MSRAAQTHLAGRVFETPAIDHGSQRWKHDGPLKTNVNIFAAHHATFEHFLFI